MTPTGFLPEEDQGAFMAEVQLPQGASVNRTLEVVKRQLKDLPHPEHGYRRCLGLLNHARRYGKARLEAACERALAIHSPSYRSVSSILKQGLDRQPYPGDLGKRVFDNVSKQAWQDWLRHQTMLINENRLSPMEPKARKFLEEQMEKYFFGEGADLPPDYVAPK